VDNFVAEPNETVILTLTANAAYNLSSTVSERTATVTILDNEPTLSIAATDSQAAEPNDTGTFTISRTGSTGSSLTVYFTRTGTAILSPTVPTGDYTLSGNVLTATSVVIPAVQDHVDITVTPVDNFLTEPNETVILTLTANAAYNLTPTISQRTATVTIADDEPTITIVASDSQAAEPNLTGVFTISRTGSTVNTLTVYFTRTGTAILSPTVPTGDYTLSGNVLTATSVVIPAVQDHVDITVTPVDNFLTEPNETVILTLTANAAYNLTPTISQRTATVTIADDEPTISIVASDSQAAEPNDTGTFTISRTGSTGSSLTVYFSRTGTATYGSTSDYTLSTLLATSVVIPAVQDHVDITVTPVDNFLTEPNETVILTLTANAAYNLTPTISQRTATVTIADDEPTISVTASDREAAEPNLTGVFTISRTGSTDSNLTVSFSRTGTATFGSDYTLSGNLTPLTVVIPAGQEYVDITVSPVDNFLVEPSETVILTLTANATYNLTPTVPRRTATVTILDNEPTISIAASDNQAAETVSGDDANTGTFTISRTGSTDSNLTVSFSRTGTATYGSTGDYTLSGNLTPLTVVIPAGQEYVDITVSPVDNFVAEPSETVILTLTANPAYNLSSTVSEHTATVTILDNE
jgi:hypothetical protein